MHFERPHTPANAITRITNDADEERRILHDQANYNLVGHFAHATSQHYRDYPYGSLSDIMDPNQKQADLAARGLPMGDLGNDLGKSDLPYPEQFVQDLYGVSGLEPDAYGQQQLYNGLDAQSALSDALFADDPSALPLTNDALGSSNTSRRPAPVMKEFSVTSPGGTPHSMPVRFLEGSGQKKIDPMWLNTVGAYAGFGTDNQVERQGPESLLKSKKSRHNLFQRGTAGGWNRTDPVGQEIKNKYNDDKQKRRTAPGSTSNQATKARLAKMIQKENTHLTPEEIQTQIEEIHKGFTIEKNYLMRKRNNHENRTWNNLTEEEKQTAKEASKKWRQAKNMKQSVSAPSFETQPYNGQHAQVPEFDGRSALPQSSYDVPFAQDAPFAQVPRFEASSYQTFPPSDEVQQQIYGVSGPRPDAIPPNAVERRQI